MKKIILAATGEELEWRDTYDGSSGYALDTVVGQSVVSPLAYCYHRGSCVLTPYGRGSTLMPDGTTKDEMERALVTAGIIRIEETAEPQPGPSREEYLIGEARAIILDAARNNFDHKRALRFIADSEGK